MFRSPSSIHIQHFVKFNKVLIWNEKEGRQELVWYSNKEEKKNKKGIGYNV